MPWEWGRRTPPAGQVVFPVSEAPSPSDEAPLVSDPRFRVQDIYTITGVGCVLVGELEAGELRPPTVLRVLDDGGARRDVVVRMVQIMAHRAEQPVLRPGTSAGLTVRGMGRWEGRNPRELKQAFLRGDLLVPAPAGP